MYTCIDQGVLVYVKVYNVIITVTLLQHIIIGLDTQIIIIR